MFLLSAFLCSFLFGIGAQAQSPSDFIRETLSAPDSELSYERAKITFDRIIAPRLNEAAVNDEIDQLANAAARIATGGNDIAKLQAIQRVIYQAGEWNANRPFVYDHDDPYGQDLRNKLLATYLNTRRGNCVSMPILQLIVAERLGLNVSLSTARSMSSCVTPIRPMTAALR